MRCDFCLGTGLVPDKAVVTLDRMNLEVGRKTDHLKLEAKVDKGRAGREPLTARDAAQSTGDAGL